MDIFLELLGIGLGILALTIAQNLKRKQSKSQKGTGGQSEIMIIDRDGLVSLQRENPDLPPIPSATALYEVWEAWFDAAKKRILIDATRRTREEQLKLNDQILRYQLQYITHLQNKVKIKEITELSALELDSKKETLLTSIAESKAKREALQRQPEPPPPVKSEQEQKLDATTEKRTLDARYKAGEDFHVVREWNELVRLRDQHLKDLDDNQSLTKAEYRKAVRLIWERFNEAEKRLTENDDGEIFKD